MQRAWNFGYVLVSSLGQAQSSSGSEASMHTKQGEGLPFQALPHPFPIRLKFESPLRPTILMFASLFSRCFFFSSWDTTAMHWLAVVVTCGLNLHT